MPPSFHLPLGGLYIYVVCGSECSINTTVTATLSSIMLFSLLHYREGFPDIEFKKQTPPLQHASHTLSRQHVAHFPVCL